MKYSQLPFMPEMARAWYDDRKTQTRRIVMPTQSKPRVAPLRMEPWIVDGERQEDDNGLPCWAGFHPDYPGEAKWFTCPYGGPGDRVWIRETLVPSKGGLVRYECDQELAQRDGGVVDWPWQVRKLVPRYMPRWACRSYGEIVDVRVERVQDISEADAIAEGVFPLHVHSPIERRGADDYRGAFAHLWDTINAERGYGWQANPWVWVLTLRRISA